MQLRLPFITAAVLLTTGAIAASIPVEAGLVAARSDVANADNLAFEERATSASADALKKGNPESQVAQVINKFDKLLEKDLAALIKLQHGKHSKSESKAVFAKLVKHLEKLGHELRDVAHAHGKRAEDVVVLAERQDILEPAIKHLSANLNKIFPQVRLTLRHLTHSLGLNTVSIIVEQITGGVKQIDLGLEHILKVVAKDTGKTLVDPLLRLVDGLLASLGINLNAREEIDDVVLESRKAHLTKSQAKHKIAEAAAAGSVGLKADLKAVNAMINKIEKHGGKVTKAEAEELFDRIKRHAHKAAVQINAARSEVEKRADPAQPTDFEGAVVGLVKDLNKLLPRVRKLLRVLLKDLQLNTVNKLVDGLTPVLGALVGAVEGLLLGLGGPLSALLNPLLTGVVALVKGLGIDLNNNTGRV